MFVLKLLPLSLLILVSCVSSKGSDNVEKSSYMFNHPPQPESYQSIPVAIVYDGPEYVSKQPKERVATTYHPRFRGLEVTEPSNIVAESPTNEENNFLEEEEKRVKRLRKILRQARLRLRSENPMEQAPESIITLAPNLMDDKEVESSEKIKPLYKEMNRNNRRRQDQTDSYTTTATEIITSTEPLYAEKTQSISQEKSTLDVSRAQQQDISTTIKANQIETTQFPPNNKDRQKGRRVRPRVQPEAPSFAVTDETIQLKVDQTNKKENRGRGSVRYRNNDQSTKSVQRFTSAKPLSDVDAEDLVKPQFNKNIEPVSERDNYPSSEQPKLTNNRPGPRNVKPRKQNNVLTSVAVEDSTDKLALLERSKNLQQEGEQRLLYFSPTTVNDIEKEKNIPSSSAKQQNNPSKQLPTVKLDEENYPKLPLIPSQQQKYDTTLNTELVSTTEKENYPELPLIPQKKQVSNSNKITTSEKSKVFTLATKQPFQMGDRSTTMQPLITTEEENYPQLPIVPIQTQTKSTKTILNEQDIHNTDNGNNTNLISPLVSSPNEKTTLSPITTTEGQVLTKTLLPQINKLTTQQISTPPEENYPKTIKSLPQFINKIANANRKLQNIFSTDIPQNAYQQTTQEQPQNEVTVPRDVDGKVITLKSSFDVATLTPLAKSFLQKNNKAKVIYKVQRADSDYQLTITDEPITLQTTEEIASTTETTFRTEKPNNKESEKKTQRQYSGKIKQESEDQIPVVIVYDDSDTSIPVSQRKILRTKINPVDSSKFVGGKSVELVNNGNIQESQKSGNITENVNAERRTRGRKPVVPILDSENHVYAQTGKFNYRYESGDGTNAFQEGILKPFDNDVTGEAVKGGFSYTDKDGNDFSLSYTADENGYRPIGAHLPTPPPIPPAIARALAHLATKTVPDPDEVTESASIDVY